MESSKTLQIRYSVYDYSQSPSVTIDEGRVKVSNQEEGDQVAYEIIDEINATHRNRGYRYMMSVVLEEITRNSVISGQRHKLVSVYRDCI